MDLSKDLARILGKPKRTAAAVNNVKKHEESIQNEEEAADRLMATQQKVLQPVAPFNFMAHLKNLKVMNPPQIKQQPTYPDDLQSTILKLDADLAAP